MKPSPSERPQGRATPRPPPVGVKKARGGPAPSGEGEEELVSQVHRRVQRVQRWLRDGEPTVARQLAAVGVLGWIIVLPLLAGVAGGRWLDHRLGSGLLFTAALLLVGLVVGCWSAWRWMHDA